MTTVKRLLVDNVKNMRGWRTSRKIVAFSVDDYGNVRIASPEAREAMDRSGLRVHSRFDAYDALETTEDLAMLYEVLTSVSDMHGRPAVFTAFAVPCNIDFEKVEQEGFERYVSESLPATFEKLASTQGQVYEGAWELWRQGISTGILVPQFHGREHLNIKVFEEKLRSKDPILLTALRHRSYTSIGSSGYATIGVTAAFDFDQSSDNTAFEPIIRDGLNLFESVFGYRAVHFNAPGGQESSIIHSALSEGGIEFLDVPWLKREHLGDGRYIRRFNYSGKTNEHGQTFVVRNAVFEPSDNRGFDWISHTLKQIESAFHWRRPAIVSSHRANFCGRIDAANRHAGLSALRLLLHKIVRRWPDVEFYPAHDVGKIIAADMT